MKPFLLLGWLPVLVLLGCAHGPRAFVAGPLDGDWTVAVLPLANFTEDPGASDQIVPVLAVELSRMPHLQTVEQGRVEDVLSREPWIMLDRVPPDLVDLFGEEMQANALLIGSILAYGYMNEGDGTLPQVSIALRLLETPGGRVLWSAVHSRDGGDGETVFGLGRETSLEKTAARVVREILDTLPEFHDPAETRTPGPAGK